MNGMEQWPTMDSSAFGMMAQMGAISSAQTSIRRNQNATDFDPYQAMLNRKKRMEEPESTEVPTVIQHSHPDIQALEEFCQQYGIIGFNCGRMSPRAALQFLKTKMGVREELPVASNKTMLHG